VERDLSERDRSGEFRWSVRRSMDPQEVGIDLTAVIVGGQVAEADDEGSAPGLVHEPSFGEAPPPGYVHSHPEKDEPVEFDTEVAAPFRA
jgi:hypothetical protein